MPARTLMRLRQRKSGRRSLPLQKTRPDRRSAQMTYSFTQIANYLRCPRSYRHRYLDGWREKETRAAMIFVRCFEKALESIFKDGDCGATLFQEWNSVPDAPLECKKAETCDRLLPQGMRRRERFTQY